MGASPGLATAVSVLVLLLAASNGGPISVSTASPTVAVSECRTISTPGHYELTADLSAPGPESCVRVLASDVHLDGNGHVLRTSGPTRSLVVVRNASNVTVRNLTTVGATAGVTYWNVSRGRIEAVTATAAGRMGIWVVDSAGVEVVRSRAAGNAVSGIRLDDTTGSSVTGVEATGNAAGVALGRARANEVRDSSLRRNQIGIQLAGATGNTIAANTVEDNEFGMVLAVSTNNSVVNNTLSQNGDGVRLDEADGNRIHRNHLLDHAFGIYLNAARGNTVEENVIDGADVGIELTFSSDDNAVIRNRITAQRAGIRETASGGNALEGNEVAVTGDGTMTRSPAVTARDREAVESSPDPSTDRTGANGAGLGYGSTLASLGILVVVGAALAWRRFRRPRR